MNVINISVFFFWENANVIYVIFQEMAQLNIFIANDLFYIIFEKLHNVMPDRVANFCNCT